MTTPSTPQTRIYYTDGSYDQRTGIGGYAIVPLDRDGEIVRKSIVSAGFYAFNSIDAELQAVIKAIRLAPKSVPVKIYSDCCVISDVAARRSIKNRGQIPRLWKTFLALLNERTNIVIAWVRGHAEDPVNCFADHVAKKAAKDFAAFAQTAKAA